MGTSAGASVYANGRWPRISGRRPACRVPRLQEKVVPKSKVRKKPDAPVRVHSSLAPVQKTVAPSPSWYPIVMAVVLVVGLAYLVVYYLAADKIPVMQDLGAWNFAVGFGVMMLGLGMAVRWR
jgi:hypothetical protein